MIVTPTPGANPIPGVRTSTKDFPLACVGAFFYSMYCPNYETLFLGARQGGLSSLDMGGFNVT